MHPHYNEAIQIIQDRGQTQTRLGKPWGNCLEAAIATAVGIDLDDVPDLRDGALHHGVTDSELATLMHVRGEALRRWLAEQYNLLMVRGVGSKPPWLDLKGPDSLPVIWIATGPANRGLTHAVVYADDKLVFDPHPSRDGLEGVTRWSALIPLGAL
jgi:hypothetical protein